MLECVLVKHPARCMKCLQTFEACCGADGNAAVTGAYAALAEYYSNNQGKQNDCGLNLGWSHPGARATKKSVNNIKACAPLLCKTCWPEHSSRLSACGQRSGGSGACVRLCSSLACS
jgi:hypothetical protein